MNLVCPCCRATNATPTCRRCRADLSLLAAVEERRSFHFTSAKRFAAEGRVAEGLRHLHEARRMRDGIDLTQLSAVLHLMQGDYARAIAAYDGWNNKPLPT